MTVSEPFLTGYESQETMDEANNHAIHELNTSAKGSRLEFEARRLNFDSRLQRF